MRKRVDGRVGERRLFDRGATVFSKKKKFNGKKNFPNEYLPPGVLDFVAERVNVMTAGVEA